MKFSEFLKTFKGNLVSVKDHKDCAVIKIANMDNVLRLVLKRGIYRNIECDGGEKR